MLRGSSGVSILDDLLRLDDLLMMDYLSGVGKHLGRIRDGPIFIVSYMIWTTTQGREILVSHPHQFSLIRFFLSISLFLSLCLSFLAQFLYNSH